MNAYFLSVYDSNSGEVAAHVYGDLDTIGYVGKKALKTLAEGDDSGQFTVKFVETESVGPESADKRVVTEFTGDADIAATVLRKKLATERKQQASASEETTTSEALEPATDF